jgi:hypothetical protein
MIAWAAAAALPMAGATPSALQGVDEAGRVTDEEHAASRRDRADHAHLQPASEALAVDGPVEQAAASEMTAEGVEACDGTRRAGAVGS